MKSASLNHVYRLVWSHASQTYVAVAETLLPEANAAVSSGCWQP